METGATRGATAAGGASVAYAPDDAAFALAKPCHCHGKGDL
jgi:hypothetical protein